MYLYPLPNWPRRTDPANPIGANIEVNNTAIVKPYRPRYSDSSPGAVAYNTKALKDAIRKLSDLGGVLEIERELFFEGPLENPRRVFHPQPDPRPLNFGIRGTTPRATLVSVTPGAPAIRFTGGQAFQYAGDCARLGLRDITVASQGTGVEFRNCGEQLELSQVSAVECKNVGFDFDRCYGFQFDRLVARNCWQAGVRMTGCKLARWGMIHARQNGVGVQIFEDAAGLPSGHLSGAIDAEGNSGWGLDCDLVRDSDLQLWLEGNNAGGFQGRLRNCYRGLRLWGELADERGQDFDCDNISANTVVVNGQRLGGGRVTIERKPARAVTAPNLLTGPTYSNRADHALEYAVAANTYQTFSGGRSYINFDVVPRQWQPGEWAQVDLWMEMDDAGRDYFAANSHLFCGQLRFADPDVPGGFDANSSQNIGGRVHGRCFSLITRCKAACTPRLMWFPMGGAEHPAHKVVVSLLGAWRV